jgi:hypothetical protein
MFPGPNYAQILRAIGQDLEASKLRYFDLVRAKTISCGLQHPPNVRRPRSCRLFLPVFILATLAVVPWLLAWNNGDSTDQVGECSKLSH